MNVSPEQVEAGQAIYSKPVLSTYDLFVLGISNRYIWKCPSAKIETLYNDNISANHLDVGVGTGYFLRRCRFPTARPRIALMDMNVHALAFTAARIARYVPERYQQNILQPLEHEIPPFDSIGANYLFHCLPGAIGEKMRAFDHLKTVMKPNCRIFGSTILQGDLPRSWSARQLMAFYNLKGIFNNTADDYTGLRQALAERFQDVRIETSGCVALFSAVHR